MGKYWKNENSFIQNVIGLLHHQRHAVFGLIFIWMLLLVLYSNRYEQITNPFRDNIKDSFKSHEKKRIPDTLINYSGLESKFIQATDLRQNSSNSLKTILYFTKYFKTTDFDFGFGQNPFIDKKCPVNDCFATDNHSLLARYDEFDAIIFHIRNMNDGQIPIPKQNRRHPNQRYVMFLMESPLNDNFPYKDFGNFFNWTMTYRMDSDFVRPYAWIEPLDVKYSRPPTVKDPLKLNYPRGNTTIIKEKLNEIRQLEKSKHIAWMVSNCYSKSEREYLVQDLQRYLSIDIYGDCGILKCPKHDEDSCMNMVGTKYKFYLSFENSVCDDYVTEKLFKVMKYDIIPIVLGGCNYSKIAPVHSYIDARDFDSIINLSEYISYLDKNETAYAEYFEWKKYFRVVMNYDEPFCQLCEALNDPASPQSTYSDIDDWWRTKSNCITKGNFPWSRSGLQSFWFLIKQSATILFNKLTFW